MRCAVDAPREAAHHCDPARGKITGQTLGERQTVRGGAPRAHDGHGERVLGPHRSAHPERGRRIVEGPEVSRKGLIGGTDRSVRLSGGRTATVPAARILAPAGRSNNLRVFK